MVTYVNHFLVALLFTVSVETVLILFLLKKVYRHGEILVTKIISAGIFASGCTIPYVWFVFPFIFRHPTSLIFSELFAFVVEAIFYKFFLKISTKQAIVISLITNLASYAFGRILLG